MSRGRVALALLVVAAALAVVSPASAQSCPQPGAATPILMVHGMGRESDDFSLGSPSIQQAVAAVPGTFVDTFDYRSVSRKWVTDPGIGAAMAGRIACLGDAAGTAGGTDKVIVVTHSMGALALRQAASMEVGGRPVSDRVGLVVTLGAPHGGSWLEGALTLGTTGPVSAWLLRAVSDGLHERCTGAVPGPLRGVCEPIKDPTSDAALAMRPGSDQLNALPKLPSGPVRAVAGQIHLITTLFGRDVRIPTEVADIGDILVRQDSALQFAAEPESGGGRVVRDCDMKVLDLVAGLGWNECTHGGLLTDPDVISGVGQAVRTWLDTRPLGPLSRI
ncbi:MAG: hypothetical protein LC799_19475, partial [Actinobacteria bacterium]|nr:hypothetical protein [Actinomycetota bacterium]